MMVKAFILAVAMCSDCEYTLVGTPLMAEPECNALLDEFAQAYPYRVFDCAPVPNRTVEVVGNETPAG